MHPISRIPGFVIIMVIGLAIIGYGLTLDLNPNWIVPIGVIFIIIAILSVTVVR